MEVRYYEGVNYLNLSKDDYSKVIDNYTPAQSKSIAGKSIVIPKDTNPYREPMARLIAKQDIPLLKRRVTVHIRLWKCLKRVDSTEFME